jgi:hypothetical protein
MRRRTADFLQGKRDSKKYPFLELIVQSPPKSTTRERRKGEKDGEWADFQGAGKLRKLFGVLKIQIHRKSPSKPFLIAQNANSQL